RNEKKTTKVEKKMKKMLIVLTALTVMGTGFIMAEDKKTEPKEPSTAYMHGYNEAAKGNRNRCDAYGVNRSANPSRQEKITFECNQGYFQGQTDKPKQQSEDK
ncbi:MAG: hypothetical protein K2M99_00985, partial [Treponemataceae bacterium]|nr:hypothetical protein [Treponemataceae bacterium]